MYLETIQRCFTIFLPTFGIRHRTSELIMNYDTLNKMRDFFSFYIAHSGREWQFIWNHSIKVNAQKCAKFWRKNRISKKWRKNVSGTRKSVPKYLVIDWWHRFVLLLLNRLRRNEEGPLDGLHLFWQWRMFSHERFQNENAVAFNETKSIFSLLFIYFPNLGKWLVVGRMPNAKHKVLNEQISEC